LRTVVGCGDVVGEEMGWKEELGGGKGNRGEDGGWGEGRTSSGGFWGFREGDGSRKVYGEMEGVFCILCL
jgi:hypothetical protein